MQKLVINLAFFIIFGELERSPWSAEVSPLNEAIRFGAIGTAIAYGADPVTVGAVAGGITMAVESGGCCGD